MRNTVIQGDCLEVMKDIPDKSIDMILCDLPYGVTACDWDEIIPFGPLWEQYKRITKPKGAIVLTASQPFTSKIVMSNLEWFKYEWIWKKNKASNFLQANYQPIKRHENILVFSDGHITYTPKSTPMIYNPIMAGRQTSKNIGQGTKTSLKSWRKRMGNDYKIKSNNNSGMFPISVLEFPNDEKLHPTQKPVKLFEYLIKTYTNEGDLVLDNCAGSGTTGMACINTSRDYILIEQEEKYIDIINKRLSPFGFYQ